MPRESLKSKNLKIVSIVNQKGGVGKTVTSLALSSGLAEMGERVLLIDGDPQGNSTLFFTEDKSRDISELYKELISTSHVMNYENYILKEVRKNLDILPSFNKKLRSDISENQLSDIMYVFIEFIQSLKDKYDWILIDCSPSNGRLEKMLISACEAVIVPLEFQLFSISGLSSLVEELKNCGKMMRKNIFIDSLVFVKAENRINRIREYREIFRSFYIPIYEVGKTEVIPKSVELRKTIWEYDRNSFVCKDYQKIIEKSFLGTDYER